MRAWNLSVEMDDRIGVLADAGEWFGETGMNLSGVWGYTQEGHGYLNFLVPDRAEAERLFESHGYHVLSAREVVVVDIPDRPGALGEFTRAAAQAGVNLDLITVATGTRLVGGTPGDLTLLETTWSHMAAPVAR